MSVVESKREEGELRALTKAKALKERLRIEHHVRYNDDFILIHHDKDYLIYVKNVIEEKIKEKGLKLNRKKTQIFPLTQSVKFLGFRFKLTETGKVLMLVLRNKITHERKKLRRLVNKAKRGEISRQKVDECYKSWKAHASKGNSYNLIKSMDRYYNSLWKENVNETRNS